MKDFHFEPNDKVSHIENLDQTMIVKEIKRKAIFVRTDKLSEDGKEYLKKKVNRIEGILCYWWEEGKYIEKIFHSEMLVIAEIAEKGKEEAERWIEKKKAFNHKQ